MSRRIVSRCTTVYRSATDKIGQGIIEDGSARQVSKNMHVASNLSYLNWKLTYSRGGITKVSVNQNQAGNQVNYSLYWRNKDQGESRSKDDWRRKSEVGGWNVVLCLPRLVQLSKLYDCFCRNSIDCIEVYTVLICSGVHTKNDLVIDGTGSTIDEQSCR